MTLDQVIYIIENNITAINALTPIVERNHIYEFLKKCIKLMQEEDPSQINEEFLDSYKTTIILFMDITIKGKTTQEEKTIIRAISDLLYNVSNNYNIDCCKTELNALSILSETAKSLEEILYTLIFMFNKLSGRLSEDPTNNFLSRKYYTELSEFLSKRKSHDEKYNI